MARFASFLLLLLSCATSSVRAQNDHPNILWIFVEDMNDWLGCYGDDLVKTPNIDALAARGTRFTRAYMPAGVCSPTRSAVITGCWQTSTGTHNHRSSRGSDHIELPAGVRPLPTILREAGYYTFNQGKTDYNFAHDPRQLYDSLRPSMNLDRVKSVSSLWQPALQQGKPFFGQIQLRGGKNQAPAKIDRSKVTVPPYYPDIPIVREEIGHHYDVIEKTDREVGRILAAMKQDDLLDNTAVFFFSDHGYRMHRHKQFLYEGGVRVPCIIAGTGATKGVRTDPISGIDLAATALTIAGLAIPPKMQGIDVFADDYDRSFVVSARDRCDYTIDKIRAVTTTRYKYIRNYLTDRPYMQPHYRDPRPVTKELRRMAADGRLNAVQMQFYGNDRPAEELYDLTKDPHQINNLVNSSDAQQELERHRNLLKQWIQSTGDRGQMPEPEQGLRAVLEQWGDKCVNPEFEPIKKKIDAEDAGKHRVLILGDSISIGYTPIVKKLMAEDTLIVRPNENCAGTTFGVTKVDQWLKLKGGRFDIIWFNFGLHDLKRVRPNGKNSNNPKHQRQAEPAAYEANLRQIVSKLKATGAQLIFATTTPIPEGGVRPHRDPKDAQRYNEIARRICKDHDIAVHDLYTFALKHKETIQPRVDVHFTKGGSEMLGAQVATRLRLALKEPR